MAERPGSRTLLPSGVRTISDDTLVVFLSDTHIGGDPGSDIFESPEELVTLLDELAARRGPIELVLAGDFFDFLQIGTVPEGQNRAAATIARPEYRDIFGALRQFAAGDGHQVTYLPGNHDAEVWWNPDIQRTLRAEKLVDEFALSYAVRYKSAPERVIYCEHGNQFDPANVITDYSDPLDTPLGDHIVTDLTRRIAPAGRVSRSFDLRDIGRVYPLVTVPDWIVGRIFYDLLGRIATRLLLPLLLGYTAYRIVAYALASANDDSARFSVWDSYRTLPGVQTLFAEVAWDTLLLVSVFILFFLTIRRAAMQMVNALTSKMPGEPAHAFGLGSPASDIERFLTTGAHPPMHRGLPGNRIHVFVSGHTHAPSLSTLQRDESDDVVIVNSGCWLRQMRPVPAHFGGPPVFISRFVQTHVRIGIDQGEVRVELREHPKPAMQHLLPAERLAIAGRQPEQPALSSQPRVIASLGLAMPD